MFALMYENAVQRFMLLNLYVISVTDRVAADSNT